MSIRRCNKCGCELPSTAKKNICESCRKRRNDGIKKGGGILAGIALVVGAILKILSGIGKK